MSTEMGHENDPTQETKVPSPAAGWYADPSGAPGQRYFDGHTWTVADRDVAGRHTLPDDKRTEILNQLIAREVSGGGRVESRTGFHAVIAWGRPVNHAMNAVAAFFTCGLWNGFWLLQVLFSGERREVIDIDSYGEVHRTGATRSASASWAGANPFFGSLRRPTH